MFLLIQHIDLSCKIRLYYRGKVYKNIFQTYDFHNALSISTF